MRKEYSEMEAAYSAKLSENQQKASQMKDQMQKALDKQKVDIDLVMELNEAVKTKLSRTQAQVEKLKGDLQKEKDKRDEILQSLNETDRDKVRNSQRLQTQDKEMDRMNMLYRQIASEKAALNRDKERVADKLEKKKQKHAYTKQQLEETTKQYERQRDENMQLGQIINQVMLHLKGKDASGDKSP